MPLEPKRGPDPPRLAVQAVRLMLQSHDQAVFNQKFPIFAYYRIGMLCSKFTGDTIPDLHYAAELHHLLLKARRDGDKGRIVRYTGLLRQERHKVEPVIKRFLDQYENVSFSEEIHSDVYDTHAIGVLKHEDLS